MIIQAPDEGAHVLLGTDVLIYAVASDTVGVTRVELIQDETVVAAQASPNLDTGDSEFQVLLRWRPGAPGEQTLTIVPWRGDVRGTPIYHSTANKTMPIPGRQTSHNVPIGTELRAGLGLHPAAAACADRRQERSAFWAELSTLGLSVALRAACNYPVADVNIPGEIHSRHLGPHLPELLLGLHSPDLLLQLRRAFGAQAGFLIPANVTAYPIAAAMESVSGFLCPTT